MKKKVYILNFFFASSGDFFVSRRFLQSKYIWKYMCVVGVSDSMENIVSYLLFDIFFDENLIA